MISKRYIVVRHQQEGFHAYPNAPEVVSYLRARHRHMFKIKIKLEVFQNDREVEFHMFLNWIKSLYAAQAIDLNNKSCETHAEELIEKISTTYPGRYITVTVSEDGECDGVVEYSPDFRERSPYPDGLTPTD